MVSRAALLAAAAACSSGTPRATDDAKPVGSAAPVRPGDAAVGAAAGSGSATAPRTPPRTPAATTGDAQIRVAWTNVPVAARGSAGATPCGTPRAPQVAPTTTWGIPDVVIVVEGAPAPAANAVGEARVVLADCALGPRLAHGGQLIVESAVDRPARVQVARRGALAQPDALAAGAPRIVQLPIAGHAVALALEPGALYEVATTDPQPETAWVIGGPVPLAITDASGGALIRDLSSGAHAVTAWLPPRGGQPGRVARGTVTVVAGDLAELSLGW